VPIVQGNLNGWDSAPEHSIRMVTSEQDNLPSTCSVDYLLMMQVTKSHLKQIILEEYRQVVSEKKFKQDSPSNPYHTGHDGRFTDYDGSKSWSLDDKQRRMKSGKNAKPCGRSERRRCKDGSLKWESTEEPRSDSTSDYRRDDPRYENDRMRKDKNFPGYDDMERLANGIVSEIEDAMTLEEKKGNKQCFNRNQMMTLRQSIFQQVMSWISTYENARKNTNPKAKR